MAEIKDKKKFHIFSAAYIGSTVKTGEYGGKKKSLLSGGQMWENLLSSTL